jgi:hypothetical protein
MAPAAAQNPKKHHSAAYRCCNLLPQPLLNHWPPRHQTEPLSIVEHRVPPTGEHDTPPIYADHALPVSRLPILQPGFGANVLRGLRQLAPAQRRQQVTGKDDSLPTVLGQPLFGQEIGSRPQRILDLATKAQITQSLAAAN